MKIKTIKKNLFVNALLLGAVLSLPIMAQADSSFTIGNTTADAFLAAGVPSTNFGGAGTLAISSASSPKGELDSVIKFNLSSAVSQFNTTYGVGGWHITGLTLNLASSFGTTGANPSNGHLNLVSGGLFGIDWLANDSWVEGTGNGNGIAGFPTNTLVSFNSISNLFSQGSSTLGDYTYAPPGMNVYTNFSLTLDSSLVADAMAGGDVSLYFFAADTQVNYLFNSRTFSGPTPQLVVTAVPEPATLSLGIAGIAALLWARRKNK